MINQLLGAGVAATLVGLNRLWRTRLMPDDLHRLAARLGSDVNFFLDSHPMAVCRGRGEQIESVSRCGRWFVVVVSPPDGLSTAAVYKVCQPSTAPRSVAPTLDALRRGDGRALRRSMHNALEPAARRLSPWIERLAGEFGRMDCIATQMSGSGSSYFGVCRNARHAQSVARRLRARRLGRVFTAACG